MIQIRSNQNGGRGETKYYEYTYHECCNDYCVFAILHDLLRITILGNPEKIHTNQSSQS